MKKITLMLCALVAFPAFAFAQDAVASSPVLGIGWGPIVAVVSAVAAILAALSNAPSLAGYRTYFAIAATVVAGISDAIADMTSRGEAVTVAALITAGIAAAIGRAKASK